MPCKSLSPGQGTGWMLPLSPPQLHPHSDIVVRVTAHKDAGISLLFMVMQKNRTLILFKHKHKHVHHLIVKFGGQLEEGKQG